MFIGSNSATGVKTKTYTFTFRALKRGSTTVSLNSYSAYAYDDLSTLDLTASSKTVRIITQEELAELLNITPRQVQRIENGQSRPSLKTLKLIIKILEISDEDIVKLIKEI